MIMGGLFKQTSGQMPASGIGGQRNPLQEIIEQMMRQGGGLCQPQPQQRRAPEPQQPDPFDNPLGKILDGMFGGGGQARQPEPRQTPQSPYGDNPLGKIFEEMMGGGRKPQAAPRQAQPRQQAQPKPEKTNPSGRARTPYDDLFGDLFETGAKTRDGYQKNVESVFDQFLQGMKKQR